MSAQIITCGLTCDFIAYIQTEDVVSLPMRPLSARDQLTRKLIAIGHRTGFKNEQSQNRNVSYKIPRNHKCKNCKKANVLINVHKIDEQQIYNTACATNENH